MLSQKFKRTAVNPCVYIQRYPNGKFTILLLYIDDMLIVVEDGNMIQILKKETVENIRHERFGCCKTYLENEYHLRSSNRKALVIIGGIYRTSASMVQYGQK